MSSLSIISPTYGTKGLLDHQFSSVDRTCKQYATILSKLFLDKITVHSIYSDINVPSDYKIGICFRPSDVVYFSTLYTNWFDIIILLVHEQDKAIIENTLKADLKIILDKKIVLVLNKETQEYLKEVINISSIVTTLPFTYAPKKTLPNSKPNLVLWMGPHVRKNALEGFYMAIEACKQYKKEMQLNIVCANGSQLSRNNVSELLEYLDVLSNTIINIYSNINETVKYDILSNATTTYFPSFDEGYNYPLYEAGQYNCDIIASNIPANSSAKQYISNIFLIPMVDRTIIGFDNDEINMSFHKMKMPNYDISINYISNSLNRWENIVNRKTRMPNKNQLNDITIWKDILKIESIKFGSVPIEDIL